jgi:CDP-diacylglycerol---glycerol-3-phosphate 3-phosphatidyltransferase
LWQNGCTRRILFAASAFLAVKLAVNLPNSITLTRIASVPLLIWALSPHFHLPAAISFPAEQEIVASTIFILASITDGLDGFLARRRGQITTLGMLLDPLADKLMVTAAFILLVAYNPRVMHPWIAVLVIGREFLVSGLRSIASSEGFTIEASDLGKLKTVIQIVAIVAAILNHRWDYWNFWGFPIGVHLIAVTAVYWMTIVSIISAVDYFVGFWKKIDHASSGKRKRRSSVLSRRRKREPVPPVSSVL